MIGQGEQRTPHASRITHHASRLKPRVNTNKNYMSPPFGGHNYDGYQFGTQSLFKKKFLISYPVFWTCTFQHELKWQSASMWKLLMDFWLLSFAMMNMVAKKIVLWEWRLDIGTTQLFFIDIFNGFSSILNFYNYNIF